MSKICVTAATNSTTLTTTADNVVDVVAVDVHFHRLRCRRSHLTSSKNRRNISVSTLTTAATTDQERHCNWTEPETATELSYIISAVNWTPHPPSAPDFFGGDEDAFPFSLALPLSLSPSPPLSLVLSGSGFVVQIQKCLSISGTVMIDRSASSGSGLKNKIVTFDQIHFGSKVLKASSFFFKAHDHSFSIQLSKLWHNLRKTSLKSVPSLSLSHFLVLSLSLFLCAVLSRI